MTPCPGLPELGRSSDRRILPAYALCLVSCGCCKLKHAAPAKSLYRSERFQRTRRFVEERGWPWFILSAKHGLLPPDRKIDRYDETLCTMPEEDRKKWAEGVLDDLRPRLGDVRSIVIFADPKYSEHLAPRLLDLGLQVYCRERDWVVRNCNSDLQID